MLASTITTIIVFFPVMFLFGVAQVSVQRAGAGGGAVDARVVRGRDDGDPDLLRALSDRGDARESEEGAHARMFGAFNRGYERFARALREACWSARSITSASVIGAVAVLFVSQHAASIRCSAPNCFRTPTPASSSSTIRAPARHAHRDHRGADAQRMEKVIREVIPPASSRRSCPISDWRPDSRRSIRPTPAPDSGFMMVALKPITKSRPSHYMRPAEARRCRTRCPKLQTFFSSGSIIDSVLNFGLRGANRRPVERPQLPAAVRRSRTQSKRAIEPLPAGRRALSSPRRSDYPTLKIKVDRVKAARLGLNQKDVVTNVITALTSNQMIAPSIWIDPKHRQRLLSDRAVLANRTSIRSTRCATSRCARSPTGPARARCTDCCATSPRSRREHHPAEADHYNIQRVVDVLVAPRTQDAGRHPGRDPARRSTRSRCRTTYRVTYRGSVAAMQTSFSSFGFGLAMAVVLLYLVMVAQFRSFLDPFIIMFAVPMGLIGVVWTLLLTGTTLNIESFMGIIVMVGIVVSNSILLVDFANQRRREGEPLRARRGRVRAHPHAADPDDRAGDRGRSDADGAEARRRFGGLGAAGARRGRRPGGIDRVYPGAGAGGLRTVLFAARGGGGSMRRSEMMTRPNILGAALAILVMAAALLTGCHREEVDTPTVKPRVVVIRPQRGETTRSIILPGDVVGYYQSALYAKVTGYLKDILVDKGDRVKKGPGTGEHRGSRIAPASGSRALQSTNSALEL